MNEVQNKIIKSANNLFSQLGYKKTTIDDIAKESSLSVSTIYKHFKNKEDIIFEVAVIESELINKELQQIIKKELSGTDKLFQVLFYIIDRVSEKKNFYQVTLQEAVSLIPVVDKIVKLQEKEIISHIEKIVIQILQEKNHLEDTKQIAQSLIFLLRTISRVLLFSDIDSKELKNNLKNLIIFFQIN